MADPIDWTTEDELDWMDQKVTTLERRMTHANLVIVALTKFIVEHDNLFEPIELHNLMTEIWELEKSKEPSTSHSAK